MALLKTREERLPLFLLCWCAAQPVLDVISYWTQYFNAGTTAVLALRFFMLAFAVLVGFSASKNRRLYWILAGVSVLFYIGHLLAWLLSGASFGISTIFSDLSDYIRFLQIPFFVLVFASLLKCCKENGEQSIQRGLLIAFFIIMAVVLLSVLTDTNPYTYSDKKVGLRGWFFNGNSQSAILSILVPLVLCTALKSKKRWFTVLICVLGFGELYLFATRLTYFSIFIIAVGTLFAWAVCRQLDRFRAGLLVVCALLCAAGYSISPMARNQQMVAENAAAKQTQIDTLVDMGIQDFGTGDYKSLGYAYEVYLGGLVDKFGLERVAEQYNNSVDVSVIGNARLRKINFARLTLEDQPVTSLFFGINASSIMTYNGEDYDVENDFYGLLYHYGIVGLTLFALFLLYFFILIIRALLKNAKQYFTVEAAACGIALCTCMFHIVFTFGVLRRPNTSFYLSLILSAIWYLTQEKQYKLVKEE